MYCINPKSLNTHQPPTYAKTYIKNLQNSLNYFLILTFSKNYFTFLFFHLSNTLWLFFSLWFNDSAFWVFFLNILFLYILYIYCKRTKTSIVNRFYKITQILWSLTGKFPLHSFAIILTVYSLIESITITKSLNSSP